MQQQRVCRVMRGITGVMNRTLHVMNFRVKAWKRVRRRKDPTTLGIRPLTLLLPRFSSQKQEGIHCRICTVCLDSLPLSSLSFLPSDVLPGCERGALTKVLRVILPNHGGIGIYWQTTACRSASVPCSFGECPKVFELHGGLLIIVPWPALSGNIPW